MRVWLVAAVGLTAMFLLFGVASAQTYTIRVTYNTNLRASYSLSSAIVGSAPAGTTLQVVGKHDRWLRVNRNGNVVWMADWVAYTRVEDSEPTPGEGAGDINNCCFVDRQCSSDQEWTDGYWAFQNNQCAAPGQSVLSVDQVEIKRRSMRIEGSARFISSVNASLDMLKARAPRWYDYTVFGLDWILAVPEGTIVSSPTHVRLWLFGEDFPYIGDTDRFASTLVHEACHNYQRQDGRAFSGLEAERECLTRGIEALSACCPGHASLPGMRHRLANIDKPEYQWWHGCDYVDWHGDESECD